MKPKHLLASIVLSTFFLVLMHLFLFALCVIALLLFPSLKDSSFIQSVLSFFLICDDSSLLPWIISLSFIYGSFALAWLILCKPLSVNDQVYHVSFKSVSAVLLSVGIISYIVGFFIDFPRVISYSYMVVGIHAMLCNPQSF